MINTNLPPVLHRFGDNLHVEARAYAHEIKFLISTITISIDAVHPVIYSPTPIQPSYQSLFCLNSR